jgi:hypothetical protein
MFNSRHSLYQVLFVKAQPCESGYPPSREDWYANRT